MTERASSLLAAMAQRVLQRHGIAKVDHSPVAPTKRERADAFDAWFRDSKVVDTRGAPLPVYHGTGADVTAFQHNPRGIVFTEDPEHASSYAALRSGAGNIVPAYLAIQHPYIQMETVAPAVSELMARGHDGINRPHTGVWVAFHPEQIKSVYNSGTYDAADPDIRFARQAGAILPPPAGPAFDTWFSGSVAVERDGQPQRLIHGTRQDFEAFAPFTHLGTIEQANLRLGDITGTGERLIPVHLQLRNPLRVQDQGSEWEDVIEGALEAGHDGIVYLNRGELSDEDLVRIETTDAMSLDDDAFRKFVPSAQDSYIAFTPQQIKSIFNTGAYEPANPDIRFSRTHPAALPMTALAMPFAFGAIHAAPIDEATLSTRLAACADTIDADVLADDYAQAHERYLHGECHVLALALHARTQAPLWAAIETRGERAGCLIHAFVKTDAGVIDLLGLRSRAAMLQEFDVWEPSFEPIEPEALAQIASAMSLSELVPELRAAQEVATAVLRIAETQRRMVAQAAFDRWFHDSKAVTAEGRPLVAYHGTATDFTAFDPVAEGIDGIYFSSSPEIAAEYAHWRGTPEGGAAIYPVHLAIRNPLEVTDLKSFEAHEFQMRIYDAQEAGHDGVVFRDVRDGWDSQTCADTWVAFQPTQIKSIFNAGTYAPGNPDIRFARDRTRALPALQTPSAPSGRTDRDSACEP